LGHRIVIYTRPAQVIASPDIAWLKRVLAHELAHQITFLTLRKSVLGIYSEIYKTSHLPAWFVEGVAQYEAESWDAKRNTFFAHALYNSALEPYPNLATYTKQDPVSGRLVYEQGHAFVRYLCRQDPRFLARLLRRIRVIPIWTELKELLSPLTASLLPLEDAIWDVSDSTVQRNYRHFLDSMNAGMRGVPGSLPQPMLGGIPGFDVVYRILSADSSASYFTGQKEWEQPYASLYRFRGGKAEKIGPDFVNPVFDLSPDGKRLLYVRTFVDPDGDPVEKLFLLDPADGTEAFISDGAAHPIFLGNDSLAFSHYAHGRQALALCSAAQGAIACRETAADSLVGFYALSRSSRGILLNATDTAGRTGVYEYRQGSGFARLFQDTVSAEFPVEAADGSILVVRDRDDLLQVDAWNPVTGAFTPAATYPLGTFYLHRSSPGVIASVVQTGRPGGWSLKPVEVRPETAAAPATEGAATPPQAAYTAPSFLPDTVPALDNQAAPPAHEFLHPYRSIGEIQPLLVWPSLPPRFPGVGFGAGFLLQDPLEFHTIRFSGGLSPDVPFYDLEYVNRQSVVTMSAGASNLYQQVDELRGEPYWDELYLVETANRFWLQALVPPPMDLPLPHRAFLGLRAGGNWYEYRLAGSNGNDYPDFLDGWSSHRGEAVLQAFTGYRFERPYSYNYVHPLLLTDLEGGYAHHLPDGGPAVFWYARQTAPLLGELTGTLRYRGYWRHLAYQDQTARLPNGIEVPVYGVHSQGYDQDAYAGLDVPFYKGYVAELPLLGPWNYIGGGLFTEYQREAYKENPQLSGSGYFREEAFGGAKLSLLFFPLRRVPLVLSPAAQWDFLNGGAEFAFRVEYAGLADSYNLFSRPKPEYGSGLHREP
jgi:hypothetical protein